MIGLLKGFNASLSGLYLFKLDSNFLAVPRISSTETDQFKKGKGTLASVLPFCACKVQLIKIMIALPSSQKKKASKTFVLTSFLVPSSIGEVPTSTCRFVWLFTHPSSPFLGHRTAKITKLVNQMRRVLTSSE